MDGYDIPQELSLEAVWHDPDVIKLQAIIAVGGWRGRVRAYAVHEEIAAFANAIQQFTDGKAPSAELTAGEDNDNGLGLIRLRFYRIDRTGHIAGHISLASGDLPRDPRPEQTYRLAVEFGTETWPLAQFAAQLAEIARTEHGMASLPVAALP